MKNYLDTPKAAAYLTKNGLYVSPSALNHYRIGTEVFDKQGPVCHRIGWRIMYDVKDLDIYLEGKRIDPVLEKVKEDVRRGGAEGMGYEEVALIRDSALRYIAAERGHRDLDIFLSGCLSEDVGYRLTIVLEAVGMAGELPFPELKARAKAIYAQEGK
jgi:hypothetical protein